MANFFFQLAPRIGCLLAAIALHRSLLIGSLHAPLQFFDTTPTGRILARFSKDIDVLDTTLPGQVADMVTCGLEVIFVEATPKRDAKHSVLCFVLFGTCIEKYTYYIEWLRLLFWNSQNTELCY